MTTTAAPKRGHLLQDAKSMSGTEYEWNKYMGENRLTTSDSNMTPRE